MLTDTGTLSVRAYTAAGALPVEGALVKISGGEEANRFISRTLLTDRDGTTKKIELPAPKIALSLTPNPSEAPYAVYDMEITKDGYFTKKIIGITVFPGQNSQQIINMIPNSRNDTEDYPRGNVNTVIPNNDITE